MASDFVENYFKSIGIGRPKSWGVYVKHGRKRFGGAFDELVSVVEARANGSNQDPYELKNSSLELSLHVGEYYASAMWREFASWLAREGLPAPSGLLDIGCERGVLTCFYSLLWPNAEVVGVDRSSAAVAAARELAKKLGLSNVAFEHTDARRYFKRMQRVSTSSRPV